MSIRPVVLALVAATACYRYTPLDSPSSAVGQSVRVDLTDRGSIDLAPLIGPTIIKLDGTIALVRDTAFSLSVTNAVARNGIETPWKGERVDLPRSAVSRLQRRALDKRRSWLVAAGGVAGTVALGITFDLLGTFSGGRNGNVGGGPR